MEIIDQRERVLGGLWGSLAGDALGVPVEFQDRAMRAADPVTGMRGQGTHRQPAGTWSDDGALILCTADSLAAFEFNTQDMGRRFVEWMYRGLWTAGGEPFDVGIATSDALIRIENGAPAEEAGGRDEYSNGNGSLMRILPVALRFAHEPAGLLAERLSRTSAITHRHDRSKMACAFYGFLVRALFRGCPPQAALDEARAEFVRCYEGATEFAHFHRVLEEDFARTPESGVASSGYVINTLHASLWCLLTTSCFAECVLKAVNLGGDTDTTGCVAGGLAGVYHGLSSIPEEWLDVLPRREELGLLFDRFELVVPRPE